MTTLMGDGACTGVLTALIKPIPAANMATGLESNLKAKY
jgi:hypothetical protein